MQLSSFLAINETSGKRQENTCNIFFGRGEERGTWQKNLFIIYKEQKLFQIHIILKRKRSNRKCLLMRGWLAFIIKLTRTHVYNNTTPSWSHKIHLIPLSRLMFVLTKAFKETYPLCIMFLRQKCSTYLFSFCVPKRPKFFVTLVWKVFFVTLVWKVSKECPKVSACLARVWLHDKSICAI